MVSDCDDASSTDSETDVLASRQEIRRIALAALTRREHSRVELHRKLVARGYIDEHISVELKRLSSEGLQSDSRFAESYVHYRSQRGFGPTRIRMELRDKGLEEGIIAESFDTAEIDWRESLLETWRKKFGANPIDYRDHAKQAKFLVYRGYASSEVSRFLNSRGRESAEDFVIDIE